MLAIAIGIGILTILIWLMCGTLAHGISFAHLQKMNPETAENDYGGDLEISKLMDIFGPIGLVFLVYKYGFRSGLKFW